MAQDSGWQYSASIYGWLTGMKSTVSTTFGDVTTKISARDVLSNLDIGFMGTLEARNGRWSLAGDLIYSDLSSSKPTPFGVLFGSADVAVKMTVFSGYVTYRVTEDANRSVDVAGGLRGYAADMKAVLSAGTLPARTLADSRESWVDPVVGVRVVWTVSERWNLTGFADIGGLGIGSDLTWQVLATADYRLNDKWSLRFGYRYLEFDKPINGRNVNLALSGPIFGATFRF